MEQIEVKLLAWKGLYEELEQVQAQVAAAIEGGDVERVSVLKDEAARLAMRSDAALQAIHAALSQRSSCVATAPNHGA